MIDKNTKISKMLEAYPQTLEVMLHTNSHFKKLQNKFLRRTVAKRVTVEQAAGIAGVSLEDLLRRLNLSIKEDSVSEINEEAEEESEEIFMETEKPEKLKNIPQGKIVGLDVREDIAAGNDPFIKIMGTVKSLKNDEVLKITNVFEPIPLYSILKKKGLEHYTERTDDIWQIYFYKEESLEENEIEENAYEATAVEEKVIELDVRNLPPPEPMIKIFEMLPQMDDKTVMLVHHHREPMMLYEKLEERGFEAVTNKIEENYFKVVITKKKKPQ